MSATQQASHDAVVEKLRKAGIEDLLDLSPFSEITTTNWFDTDPAPSEQEAKPLPLEEIPPTFTHWDHLQRNRLLPAVPTREEYLQGYVRSFRPEVAAEFIEFDEQTIPESATSKRLKALAYHLQHLRDAAISSRYQSSGWHGRFLSHGVKLKMYHAVTLAWSYPLVRVLAIFAALQALNLYLFALK